MNSYFYSEKQKSNFKPENASIYVISEEQIVYGGWVACFFEHVIQIVILSVQVSHHDDGLLDLHKVGFRFFKFSEGQNYSKGIWYSA